MSRSSLLESRLALALVETLSLLDSEDHVDQGKAVIEGLGYVVHSREVFPAREAVRARWLFHCSGGMHILVAPGVRLPEGLSFLQGYANPLQEFGDLLFPGTITRSLATAPDIPAIAALPDGDDLVMAGHSGGGAWLGVVAAGLAFAPRKRRFTLHSFGCPAFVVGQSPDLSRGQLVVHWENDGDGVTRIPAVLSPSTVSGLLGSARFPALNLPWHHLGSFVAVDSMGSVRLSRASVATGAALQTDLISWIRQEPGVTTLCHSLGEYRERVRRYLAAVSTSSSPVDAAVAPPVPHNEALPEVIPPAFGGVDGPFVFSRSPLMSVANPRVDGSLLPKLHREAVDAYNITWMGRIVCTYSTRAQAAIEVRNIIRWIRRLCGSKAIQRPPLLAAMSDFLTAASVDDGRIVPPPIVV